MVFSQNKASKTVADISVSGTKLHVSYSDGTSKDMDMPPATSIRLPYVRMDRYENIVWNTLGATSAYLDIKGASRGDTDFLVGYFYGPWGTSESRIGFQSRQPGGE